MEDQNKSIKEGQMKTVISFQYFFKIQVKSIYMCKGRNHSLAERTNLKEVQNNQGKTVESPKNVKAREKEVELCCTTKA